MISSFDVNISNAKVQMHADEKASILFEVALPDLAQLQRVLIRIEGIDGVISAERYYL
ncbi:MAG: ACT domain-containing protein [Bdellovibrionota bacterium]